MIEDLIKLQQEAEDIPYEEVDPATYDSDVMDTDAADQDDEDEEEQEETTSADLGGGWGRIMFDEAGMSRWMFVDQPNKMARRVRSSVWLSLRVRIPQKEKERDSTH